MDEFGVLVESIGFKAQGKSAPMAKLKSQPKQPSYENGFPQNIGPSSKPLNNDPFYVDDLDGIFRSSNVNKNSHDFFGGDDVFGGAFSGSKPSGGAAGGTGLDDLFGGNSSSKGSSSSYDDLLFGNASRNDDVFGLNTNNSTANFAKNGSGFDDLIPGFGQSYNGAKSATGRSPQSSGPANLVSPLAEDSLSIFESFASYHEHSAGKSSSSIDELEDFAMGRSQNNTNEQSHVKISKEAITEVQEKLRNMKDLGDKRNAAADGNIKVSFLKKEVRNSKVTPGTLNHRHTEKDKGREQRVTSEEQNNSKNEDDLEAFFRNDGQTTNARRARSTNEDPMFDVLFNGRGETKVEKPSSQTSHSTKKASSFSTHVDDFSFLFEEPAPSAVEFQEIDGEPEERRRARFNNHIRTKKRMAKALQEKNQRDLHAQHEQEEKRRLSETLDADIKRWAAGKEGNLRALLSSLEYVLWPECGWKPVSLTDLITSVSVKKLYHRATLCVHPDKVQQKGANVQQKYIAEKVFDLLKEAWNKFNAEELR